MLDTLIQERRSELVSYAAKPDAKDGYINKQNTFLYQLTAVRDSIPKLCYPEIWLCLETENSRLREIDPELAGVSADWRNKKSGFLAKIYINQY